MPASDFPLASRMMLDLFGQYFGSRAKLHPAHVWTLEAWSVQFFWNCSNAQRKKVATALRASTVLLQRAFDQKSQEMSRYVLDAVSRLETVQMEVRDLVSKARLALTATTPDARFRPQLDAYHCLYERFYPLVAAPFVAADALLREDRPPSEFIREDGRIHHSTMLELEERKGYASGLLTEGVERHLRNSIAHGLYEVRSLTEIRMEDRHPKTRKLTWGPVTFSPGELNTLFGKLHWTCEVLLIALVVFDVNNNVVMAERGWGVPRRESRPRIDLAEAYIREHAKADGFMCERVSEEGPSCLHLVLRISGEIEERPREIYAAGHGWARKFVQYVQTKNVPIPAQVYGLLQETIGIHHTYEMLIVDVLKTTGELVGRVVTNAAAREQFVSKVLPLEDARRLAIEDTLPDQTMPVVLRGVPREV